MEEKNTAEVFLSVIQSNIPEFVGISNCRNAEKIPEIAELPEFSAAGMSVHFQLQNCFEVFHVIQVKHLKIHTGNRETNYKTVLKSSLTFGTLCRLQTNIKTVLKSLRLLIKKREIALVLKPSDTPISIVLIKSNCFH